MGGTSLRDRLRAKFRINPDTGCWEWTASQNGHGYGQLWLDGRPRGAHRISYALHVGPIPDGLDLDHLCHVRHCVNPKHLEPVTNRENLMRGDTIAAANAGRTHCPQGHPYDTANTYTTREGKRQCRTCNRDKLRAMRARKSTKA